MKYFSTNLNAPHVSFKEALLNGLAPDGGLYMPESIPSLPPDVLEKFKDNYHELSYAMLSPFIGDEIPESDLRTIIQDAFNFPVPLTPLGEDVTLVELFHGPTFAFKDFAARFMARAMSYFLGDDELTILVATSGDTGSAIGNAYWGLSNIKVHILYPSGKVSPLQEKQLTTMGGNIHAFEVAGTFDDCQRVVKEAFMDEELTQTLKLSSANSINIGRLLPQATYYAYAFAQVEESNPDTQICVPSGNLGNLTAGLIAKKMGVPIPQFIAATNANTVVPDYLETGDYEPRPSQQTLANAMDVGNPSNFVRMKSLYGDSVEAMKEDVHGISVNDESIRDTIRSQFEKTGVVIDPHTAVGVFATHQYRETTGDSRHTLVMSTAHPAKFTEVVEPVIGPVIEMPESLNDCLDKEKNATPLVPSLEALKAALLNE